MGEVVMISEEGMELELGTEDETETRKKKEEVEDPADSVEKKDGSSEVVSWERFLPRVVLRVLLVEADDSTRQIIAALLRKCSYRVAAVSDGLMAWETLKGGPHNIDLILTEVELPSISGYALLTLVMEHDICKHIPVIMMSSQDSISMVLKCMLKGAADFLIKPVRKNELRNLWQHVWRRHMLTAEHISQDLPVAQHKLEGSSENNAASNHSSECATSSQKHKECSEKGSDPEGLSNLKHGIASNLSNTDRENYGECAKLKKISVMPKSKTGERSKRFEPDGVLHNEASVQTPLRVREVLACSRTSIQTETMRPETDRGHASILGQNDVLVEVSAGAIDLIGRFDDSPKRIYENSSAKDGVNKFEFTPQLELSLKRFYPISSKNQGVDERHTLNHSNASAFSWYSNKTLQPFFPMSASGSIELKEDVSKIPELSLSQLSQDFSRASQHGATLNSSQDLMTALVICQSEQAETTYPSTQLGLIPIPGVKLDNVNTFPPVCYTESGLPPAWGPKVTGQWEQSPVPSSTSVHSSPEIHDSDKNHRQSDETTNNSTEKNVHQQIDIDAMERHGSPATGRSTSSSFCVGVANHNSSSGRSFSSRNDGNATASMVTAKVATPESLKDIGVFIHDGYSHCSSQREAALTKFRLKRKDRCYEKKVRYQSRKRLAEQRPRVKGQFVRQVQNDIPLADANG